MERVFGGTSPDQSAPRGAHSSQVDDMRDPGNKTGGWQFDGHWPWPAARRPSWAWLLGLGGAVLSLFLALLLRQREDIVAERLFLLNAQKRSEAVKNVINDKLVAVRALKGLFESSREVEPQEFRTFAETLLSDIRGIRLLAWGVCVCHEQREAFERATAAALNSEYRIRDWTGNQWVVATRRETYAPLVYVSGALELTVPAECDLLSSVELGSLLQRAQEIEGLAVGVASDPFAEGPPANAPRVPKAEPASSGGGASGSGSAEAEANEDHAPCACDSSATHSDKPLMAAIIPLRSPAHSPAVPECPWPSFVVGLFSGEEIVNVSLDVFEPVGIDVWLATESSPEPLQVLAFRPSPWRPLTAEGPPFVGLPSGGLQYRDRFEVGGRSWLVVCAAIDGYYGLHRTWRPLSTVVAGWALSGLLTAFLLVVMRQSEQIEQWAAQRAAELKTVSNAALDAVVIMEPGGRVAHWNPAAERMFGYRRDEILGRALHEILVPEARRAEAHSRVAQFAKTGQGNVVGRVVEMEAVGRDGATLPIELSIAALKQHDGWWAVAVVRDITLRKRAEQAVLRERALLRQLLNLHERERQLVAFEIHDGLTQQIAGALMKVQSLAAAEAAESQVESRTYAETAALLKDALEEARRLIAGLRPPLLDEAGPAAAIAAFVEGQNRHFRGRIEFRNRAAVKRLASPIEAALFRIVQEAVNNACRYSQSDRIEVELSESCGNIELCVRDWGVGFDSERVELGHFGLQGIRERARLLGGAVEILSRSGEGTTIRVRFPIDAEGEPDRPLPTAE